MDGFFSDYLGLTFHALAQCFEGALLIRYELARHVYGLL